MDLIADTTFLVGLWRRQPWAEAFARSHAGQTLGLPWVVMGEFWHGAIRAGHDRQRVEQFLAIGLPILDPRPVVPVYASVCAALQDDPAYPQIGQNDLWIAATAIACGCPLVTRNRRHFGKIDGLRLEVLVA